MAIGDQDHGRVAMSVAAMLAGAIHQPLDLALGEIESFNCQVYGVWCAFIECRFHADKPCSCASLLRPSQTHRSLAAFPPLHHPILLHWAVTSMVAWAAMTSAGAVD
jgi:hypothetical protein